MEKAPLGGMKPVTLQDIDYKQNMSIFSMISRIYSQYWLLNYFGNIWLAVFQYHVHPPHYPYGKVDVYLKKGDVNLKLDGYQNGPKFHTANLHHIAPVGAPYDG